MFITVKFLTSVVFVGFGRVRATPGVTCGICAASAISTVAFAVPIGPETAKLPKFTKGILLSTEAFVHARRAGDQVNTAFCPGGIITPFCVKGSLPVFITVKFFTSLTLVGFGRVRATPGVTCGISAASAISTVELAVPIGPETAKSDNITKGILLSTVVFVH